MFWRLVVCLFAALGLNGQNAGALPFQNFIHGISGDVTFPDSRTISITGFSFDGGGRDVFLYSYAPGVAAQRGNQGTIIPVPSSVGEQGQFRNNPYNNVDFAVTLPQGMDVCDIGTLTVWCRPFDTIFGSVEIPRSTFVNNGADPCTVIGGSAVVNQPEFDNCIPLHETLQLSWRVDMENSQVRFRLCGCQSLQPNTNQYMGFGLSGSTTNTLMFGADPTITWVDETSGPQAVDYHLSAYAQCRAGIGACPDTLDSSGSCTNDVTDVAGSITNGQQCVSYTRPFSTSDSTCDITIDPTNRNQYIVWGVGGLGETAFQHFTRASSGDPPIHLGRTPQDQCTGIQLTCRGCQPFVNERIVARNGATFLAQIGPSGNERGYMAITGQAGWGIAWYINGTLIPELIVERNKTYTFIIEGGNTPDVLAVYHPFYITDSISGGRLQNSQMDQASETVYAGIDESGNPTGVGQLCQLMETGSSSNIRQSCSPLQSYLTSLNSSCNSRDSGTLIWTPDESTPNTVYYQLTPRRHGKMKHFRQYVVTPLLNDFNTGTGSQARIQGTVSSSIEYSSCNSGEPGQFLWSPDETTPDVVYYQCATHINLGWKITVVDEVVPTSPGPTEDISPGPTEDILNADSSVSVHGFHASLVCLHAAAMILGSLFS